MIGSRRALLTQSEWSPTLLPKLQIWLRGDRGLYQDSARSTPCVALNDPVGARPDFSGTGNHAIQAVDLKRAVYVPSNGLHVPRYDGTREHQSANNMPSGNATYFILIVMKFGSLVGQQGFMEWGGNVANISVGLHSNTNVSINHYWWSNDLLCPVTLDTTNFFVLTVDWNGTTRRVRYNGVSIGSDTPVGKNTLAAPVSVGWNPNANLHFNGDMPEFLVCDTINNAIQNKLLSRAYKLYGINGSYV